MTIDGYSQPGARSTPPSSARTPSWASRSAATATAPGRSALIITSPGNTVRGLLINNVYRGIFLDGVDAHDNRIIGNWIGFTKGGGRPSQNGNYGVVLNTGANDNVVGTPNLADRNVIGNYTARRRPLRRRAPTATSSRTTCCASRPVAARPPARSASTTTSGPRTALIGGDGAHERNVIGPTTLQGIEFSHGWDQALPYGTDTATTYQINDNSVHRQLGRLPDGRQLQRELPLGPQLLVRATTATASTSTTAPTTTSSSATTSASVYDGIQVMAPNATGNIVRGNIIGVAPTARPRR